MLDRIERVGNRMPNPAILFLLLCVLIIVLSQVLFWWGVHARYETITPPPVPTLETYYGGSVEPTDVGPTQPEPPGAYKPHTVTTKVQGLLTGEGVRYLFTSFVSNFRNSAAIAIILVVMIGVGLAETAGLIGALKFSSPSARPRSAVSGAILSPASAPRSPASRPASG